MCILCFDAPYMAVAWSLPKSSPSAFHVILVFSRRYPHIILRVSATGLSLVVEYKSIGLIWLNLQNTAQIVSIGIIAGYLPWFAMQQRTMFSFYAIILVPFMILAIVYCAKLLLDSGLKPLVSQTIVGGLFALVLLCFIYFLPLYTGQTITYDQWKMRMWFDSWI